ncbi:SulP family inorganic anion transporter [Pseudodesulfovibrio portus]|uniref:Sulfate permease n=1 Tax=Pseudodesulfovibrio portus TaxID=231439 RepID=A0ABN6RQ43_9BACT|nr:SulP family inorganic anion transporter [Pseudodesulfovibrio portus]BDQ32921.1 sulfate permease [Pseudodesulfovibrio portus]
MAIFKCGSCGYERNVPEKLVGRKAKCPDCGVGVAIVDHLDGEESVEVDFEGESPAEEPARTAPVDGNDGVPLTSLNLDDQDVEIDLDGPDDVICPACGHVLESGYAGNCPQCGAPLDPADTIPDIDEADVDVSDLAETEVPQVWDEDFNEESGDSEILAGPEDPDRWRFMQGSFSLNLYAGIVSGVLLLFLVYALSLLVVSRAGLHELLPYILGTALTGVLVGAIVNSLFSRIPFLLVGPETVLTGVLFLFVGNMYQAMADVYDPDFILPTILAGVAVAAFFTGLSLFLLGKLRLGEFVRYIPLQIIGGVIGGVGFFILLGAFDGMAQLNLDWSNIYTIATSFSSNFRPMETVRTAGPSVAFGLVVFMAMFRSKNSVFLLFMVLAASGMGFAAGIWGMSEPIRALAAPVSFPVGAKLIHPVEIFNSWLLVQNIQWGIIKANGLYIGALAVLSVLTVMFRTTKLEILRGRESDLNVEYNALGVSNMISGACGGMPVSLSYGRSMGGYAAGGRGPVTGIVTGVVCGVGLFYADTVLPMIPRFVPEGLLIYVCLDLIRDWVFRTRTAFTSRHEKWLLRLTFLTTICLGLLEGIGFGVALALMVTVSRASRGGVVRNFLTGSNHSSNVDRAPAQKRTLKEFGDHIHIMRLQGFLFLGSMEQLIKEIRVRLDDRNKLPVEYLVLDFTLVNGFASAASIGFDKLRTLVLEYGIECVITNAPLELEEHLEEMGLVGEDEGLFKVFFNLDYAMEWCEQLVLDSENMLEMKERALPELLAPVFPEPKYIPALMKVLKREVAKTGEAIFRQGDKSDSMFFVESGRLDVELEMEDGKILRLKKVGPGAVFGEMGIYTLAPRSATIRAAEKCVLYRLTLDKLDAIEKRAPMLVTAVNRFLINLLSERLADANAKVRDLLL